MWPINTTTNFVGKSDFMKFAMYLMLKEERKKEKKNKRKRREEAKMGKGRNEEEDIFENFNFGKIFETFLVPHMLSPLAKTPKRDVVKQDVGFSQDILHQSVDSRDVVPLSVVPQSVVPQSVVSRDIVSPIPEVNFKTSKLDEVTKYNLILFQLLRSTKLITIKKYN